jgi:FkbM family methyltransferase
MQLGGRDLRRVLRAPFGPAHWRALAGMPRVYEPLALPGTLLRFVSQRGRYPRSIEVRTPTGSAAARLDAPDDLSTVNEIFARRDYEASEGLRVAVDVGANIGIAALYFLTRNEQARVHCVEPDPKNVARLRRTLAGYAGRWTLEEVAADLCDGEGEFFVEETGRYGGFEQHWKSASITVPTRRFTAIVDDVLARESRIDVLKVDTEGSETALVGCLRPDQLDRITTIYYETDDPAPLHPERYEHRFACQTNALTAR